VPFVLLGVTLGLVAAGLWLWWTGARRDPAAAKPQVQQGAQDVEDAGLDPATLAGAIVVLRDNFWDECIFDGQKEDWRRFCTAGVRGFRGVPPGRHQAITVTAKGNAVFDFVLYPGETCARRLDHRSATWAPDDPRVTDEEEASALVGYKVVLGVARAMSGAPVVSPDAVFGAAMTAVERLLERVRQGEAAGTLLRDASAAGRGLTGVPLTLGQLKALTGAVGTAANLELTKGAYRRAALVASIGLGLLPDDPHLLVHLAAALCAGGVADEADVVLGRALARASVLDPDTLARGRAAKAETLVRLGRAEEARAIIDPLVAERPRDPNAARVRGLVYDKIAN
jgi:hypothetical protein